MEGLVGRFLSFDKMMAGSIVKVIYYILLVLVIGAGVIGMFSALFDGRFGVFLLTPFVTLLLILFVRVICEMYIVIFRISDNLSAIRKMHEDGTIKSDTNV